jgi:glutathione S-transferase
MCPNPAAPEITLHLLPPSHPCLTVKAALSHKGLDFEEVVLQMGNQGDQIEEIYGEGRRTVPGAIIDGEPVHGSTGILRRIDELVPEPSLYPEPFADRVREAELWADGEFQDLGRRLPWSALHFRPEAMGTFGGGEPLDPAGTDFAIKFVRSTWKWHGITAEGLAADLEALPAMVAEIEDFAEEGLIGGESPTAADFQIGSTVRILSTIRDLDPVFEGTVARAVAFRLFPDYPGEVPSGALPTGWVRPS